MTGILTCTVKNARITSAAGAGCGSAYINKAIHHATLPSSKRSNGLPNLPGDASWSHPQAEAEPERESLLTAGDRLDWGERRGGSWGVLPRDASPFATGKENRRLSIATAWVRRIALGATPPKI